MPEPTSLISAATKAAEAASKVRPWVTARRNDRLANDEYEDLITWARDDLRNEADALEGVRNDLAARGMLRTGELGYQLNRVRDEFARRWRDRKRQTDRKLRDVRDAEGVAVRLWRWLRRKPWPENPWDEELGQISALWEDEEQRRAAVQREVDAF
jgi:hypothetical protein